MDSDEEDVIFDDALFRCTTLKKAEKWVKETWDVATIQERIMIMKVFFQWPSYQTKNIMKLKTKKGGANRKDKHDIRITRLLAAADTAHDFGKMIDFKNHLPTWLQLPKEITVDVLCHEKLFLKKMANHETFTFDDEKIVNPMYKANFVDIGYNLLEQATTGTTLEEAYQKQSRSVQSRAGNDAKVIPVDIWSIYDLPNRKREVMALHQVAQTIGMLRRRYGMKREAIVDAGDSMVKMVISLQFVKTVLYECAKEMLQSNEVGEKVKALIGEYMPIKIESWDIVCTDASLFDANNHRFAKIIDIQPTGDIYRMEMAGYQVRLDGVVENGERKVAITFKDVDRESVSLQMTRKDTTEKLSKKVIADIIEENRSSGRKEETKNKDIVTIRRTFTEDLLLGIKRAGDWGMVESCLRSNEACSDENIGRVFFTMDKMAALYACYRGVPFVYVNKTEYVDDEMQIEGYPPMVQYTYCMA